MTKTCFFVSRIGDPNSQERQFSDRLLRFIVAPVLERCGYQQPVRADHITQPGVITTQVFTHLWNDDLVIADLTGNNPNVFYELAVRHLRRKPFVHLIQEGEKIPFDVAPNRTITFGFDIEKAEQAKLDLGAMIRSADDGRGTETPLSLAVDFSVAGVGADPLGSGIAQIVSDVQEIKGKMQGMHAAQELSALGRKSRIRETIMERFSHRLRELGVPVLGLGMPVEASGGITIEYADRKIEVPIGEAADIVDGIITPLEFLKRIGA
ncbi:MAG: hypothetical protein KIT83_07985 [Bryobacterales bacterium]|jgi:hypothetical protein|nr:hypothetical protein [Bryobacterales bacterium]